MAIRNSLSKVRQSLKEKLETAGSEHDAAASGLQALKSFGNRLQMTGKGISKLADTLLKNAAEKTVSVIEATEVAAAKVDASVEQLGKKARDAALTTMATAAALQDRAVQTAQDISRKTVQGAEALTAKGLKNVKKVQTGVRKSVEKGLSEAFGVSTTPAQPAPELEKQPAASRKKTARKKPQRNL